jgi:hypothetical protein
MQGLLVKGLEVYGHSARTVFLSNVSGVPIDDRQFVSSETDYFEEGHRLA